MKTDTDGGFHNLAGVSHPPCIGSEREKVPETLGEKEIESRGNQQGYPGPVSGWALFQGVHHTVSHRGPRGLASGRVVVGPALGKLAGDKVRGPAESEGITHAQDALDHWPIGPEREGRLIQGKGAVGHGGSPTLQNARALTIEANTRDQHAMPPGAAPLQKPSRSRWIVNPWFEQMVTG